MTALVVKTNRLISAIQNLSTIEIRIVQIGIVEARETGLGLSTDNPLRVTAMRYSKEFKTTRQNAYKQMKKAEGTLFNRRFSFPDEDGKSIKSRWIQQVKYLDEEGAIEIVFTTAVVNNISRIDGSEDFFTSYALEQTSSMSSNYSIRLYELLVQWKTAKKTPKFLIDDFRNQMGLGVNEYKKMSDFKRRILDSSVEEINEKSDLTVSYEQTKINRRIEGFKFKIKVKGVKKENQSNRDSDTPDIFHGMTDKQQVFFASKLADDDIFSSRTFVAQVGVDMDSYIFLIKQNLASPLFQKSWATDLLRVGYNPKN